jgi:hypothetical protein
MALRHGLKASSMESLEIVERCWVRWYVPVIPATWKARWEDCLSPGDQSQPGNNIKTGKKVWECN